MLVGTSSSDSTVIEGVENVSPLHVHWCPELKPHANFLTFSLMYDCKAM